TAEELGRRLNGQKELVLAERAVITPLAAEHLRNAGVMVRRQSAAAMPSASQPAWGYAQDRPYPLVRSAVQALERDGVLLKELGKDGADAACRWSRSLADCIARGECLGGIVFCEDPGLVCCVANKVSGLRAVA